jgi:ABC-type Fe3+ transport system substrate-binding protein
MNRTIIRVLGAIAGAAYLAFPAPPAAAIEMTPELRKVVEGAKAEGKLKIESLPDVLAGPDGVKAATAWMKAEFGIDIDGTWSPNPAFAQQAAKLFTEMQSGQKASSDAFTATAVQITPMLDRGLFVPIEWAKLMPGRITPSIVEADGRALRVLTQVPGILYNKQRLPEVIKIAAMDDLLKPEFKGKFTTTPYLAGFDVLASKEVWGPAKTADYVTKLAGQISGLLLCGATERIASGEQLALALDCSGSEHNRDRFKNVIGLHVVPDNAQRRYTYVTVSKHASNPNAATLFALYMSSPEGQRMLWDRVGFNLDNYPDSERAKEIAALQQKGIKFVDVTMDWWVRQGPAIATEHANLIKLIQRR